MKTRVSFVALVALTLALTGCSNIRGTWRMVRAVPNADTFAIREATFEKETYTARLTYEGKTKEQSGTYRYKGGKLQLSPTGGGVRIFETNQNFGELIVRDGEDRKVILRKVSE